MTNKTALSIAVAAGVVTAFLGCQSVQPKPPCLVGHGGYVVKYIPKPGQTLTGACAAKKGEVIGFQPYYNEAGTAQTKVGMKTTTLANFQVSPNVGQDPASPLVSIATLTESPAGGVEPDAQDFCYAPTVTDAAQHIPADPGDPGAGVPATPAVDIVYHWENAAFYVTAEAPGTQMRADLTYTEDGCTGRYEAWGVYPIVSCQVTDENGDPAVNADGSPTLDPTLCKAVLPGGSLNARFAVECDPDLALCVLAKPPPSFE
jgi:hypothetical protein